MIPIERIEQRITQLTTVKAMRAITEKDRGYLQALLWVKELINLPPQEGREWEDDSRVGISPHHDGSCGDAVVIYLQDLSPKVQAILRSQPKETGSCPNCKVKISEAEHCSKCGFLRIIGDPPKEHQ